MTATQINLNGRLTKDPKVDTTGKYPVVYFTLAVAPRYYDEKAGEWKEKQAQFYLCADRRKGNAATARLLRKGMPIKIEGQTSQAVKQDANGNDVREVIININEIDIDLRNIEYLMPQLQEALEQEQISTVAQETPPEPISAEQELYARPPLPTDWPDPAQPGQSHML
ncbi:single-stranded DNA-binding protein [Boudabousia marimammalium]|uniref:Single-stranded DNA-binding protein n=1 Tax=Boudabousia marimammalium TaxID=156892 RepID=A0A1Q5PMG1_9ACTO|nr:single-stranded DNA-binding protein [Boudabousia marimammalium]OKL48665.1 hypothetical protein BM477_05550 [Boudabousia marimammalium]